MGSSAARALWSDSHASVGRKWLATAIPTFFWQTISSTIKPCSKCIKQIAFASKSIANGQDRLKSNSKAPRASAFSSTLSRLPVYYLTLKNRVMRWAAACFLTRSRAPGFGSCIAERPGSLSTAYSWQFLTEASHPGSVVQISLAWLSWIYNPTTLQNVSYLTDIHLFVRGLINTHTFAFFAIDKNNMIVFQ